MASISLSSPVLRPSAEGAPPSLLSTYTCDGKDSWPDLSWTGIPSGTEELALFVMSLQPVNGKLFVNWAIAGLAGTLEGLEAAHLPRGAITGRNSYGKVGYSICPPQGSAEEYIFALYALPKQLSPHRGFDPRTLRKQVLRISANSGVMVVSYER